MMPLAPSHFLTIPAESAPPVPPEGNEEVLVTEKAWGFLSQLRQDLMLHLRNLSYIQQPEQVHLALVFGF